MGGLSNWQSNWLVASWSSWNDQSFKGQLQNVKWTLLFMKSSNFLERNNAILMLQHKIPGEMILNLAQIPLALVSASKVTKTPTGSHMVRTIYLGFSIFNGFQRSTFTNHIGYQLARDKIPWVPGTKGIKTSTYQVPEDSLLLSKCHTQVKYLYENEIDTHFCLNRNSYFWTPI